MSSDFPPFSELKLLLQNLDKGQEHILARLGSIDEKQTDQSVQTGRIEEKLSHVILEVANNKKEFNVFLTKKAGKEEVLRIEKEIEKIQIDVKENKDESVKPVDLKLLEEKIKGFMHKSVATFVVGFVVMLIKIIYDGLKKGP